MINIEQMMHECNRGVQIIFRRAGARRRGSGGKRHRFDLVAVGIEDEGAVVGRHRRLARAGCAGIGAALRQRRGMEEAD